MQCDQIFTLMFLENVVPVNYFFGFNFFRFSITPNFLKKFLTYISKSMSFFLLFAEYECLFSLYDTSDSKFVHTNWTHVQLINKGDPVVWCAHRGMFIPFSSGHKRCTQKLTDFCAKPKSCGKRKRKGLKDRGDFKKKCWKKFLLGETLPAALPTRDKYFICQRFADDTEFAQIFGTKSMYGTIYDTRNKIPLISFGRFNSLGDGSWPAVSSMLERGEI